MRKTLPFALLLGVLALIAHYVDKNSIIMSVVLLAAGVPGIVLLNKIIKICFSRAGYARKTIESLDRMDGQCFESFVRRMLRRSGFSDAELTPASGDYGADLIARKGGKRYIFQCKRYEGNVGVKAVQEIHTAKAYYNSDFEIVVTNAYFTKNARILAEESGVFLWDRDTLAGMLKKCPKKALRLQ